MRQGYEIALSFLFTATGCCENYLHLLEFDTTDNKFCDGLLIEPLDIQGQVKLNAGRVMIPTGPGIGVEPDRDFINNYSIDA